jgi:hypothetical protein
MDELFLGDLLDCASAEKNGRIVGDYATHGDYDLDLTYLANCTQIVKTLPTPHIRLFFLDLLHELPNRPFLLQRVQQWVVHYFQISLVPHTHPIFLFMFEMVVVKIRHEGCYL